MLYITVGIPGSGKSTWAAEKVAQGAVEVNRDEARKFLFCDNDPEKLFKYRFSNQKEALVTSVCRQRAIMAIEQQKDVVVSDTNLDAHTLGEWIELAEQKGVPHELVRFPDVHKAFLRNSKRSKPVPVSVMHKMYVKYRIFEGRQQYEPDASLPDAVVIDLDGTLYHMKDRGPYDHDVSGDEVDPAMLRILKSLQADGVKILLLSGRSNKALQSTIDKLAADEIEYDTLLLREPGDVRADYLIKEELFDSISDKYHVLCCFDDRDQVVNLWRAKGVKCLQVDYGDF